MARHQCNVSISWITCLKYICDFSNLSFSSCALLIKKSMSSLSFSRWLVSKMCLSLSTRGELKLNRQGIFEHRTPLHDGCCWTPKGWRKAEGSAFKRDLMVMSGLLAEADTVLCLYEGAGLAWCSWGVRARRSASGPTTIRGWHSTSHSVIPIKEDFPGQMWDITYLFIRASPFGPEEPEWFLISDLFML